MKINVVCALLFAVGIPLEFKVEIFCLNNLFGPGTLDLDCQVCKCIIVCLENYVMSHLFQRDDTKFLTYLFLYN